MRRLSAVLFVLALAFSGLLIGAAPAALAADTGAGCLVSAEPANGTPHVLDGGVYRSRR